MDVKFREGVLHHLQVEKSMKQKNNCYYNVYHWEFSFQATNFCEFFFLFIKKKHSKNITRISCDIHIIIAWLSCDVDPIVLDSDIFGIWFCQIFTMKLFDHFGRFSKIRRKLSNSSTYFIVLTMYKIV